MSTYIPIVLTSQVVERAGNRCEYRGLSQLGQEATFHVDHVQPVVAGGASHWRISHWRVCPVRSEKALAKPLTTPTLNNRHPCSTRVPKPGQIT